MGEPQLLLKSRLVQILLSRQDALVCLFNQGIVSVANFATSILIGRSAPSQLGVYYIGLTFVLFARGLQQQFVSTPYTLYHHRQSKSELPGYRGSCLMQQFGFLGLTMLYLLLQIDWIWAGWGSYEVLYSLIALLIFVPVILMREVVRHYCFTHSKNTSVLSMDLAISVLQIAGLFLFSYLGILSGATAWVIIGVACLLATTVWYFRSSPEIEFQRRRMPKDWKLNWSFGKWALAGQVTGSLPSYLVPLLLTAAVTTEAAANTAERTAGTEGTGLFAACMTLAGLANIFNMGMLNFLTPKAAKVFVEYGAAGLRQLMSRMYLVYLVAVGGFALLLILFGDFIAVNVYDGNYEGLQTVLTLLAVAKLFESFSQAASVGLFALERIKENFWVDVILMLVTIVAAVLLIEPLGVLGAAWTCLIGAATSAILRTILMVTFLRQKPHSGGQDG